MKYCPVDRSGLLKLFEHQFKVPWSATDHGICLLFAYRTRPPVKILLDHHGISSLDLKYTSIKYQVKGAWCGGVVADENQKMVRSGPILQWAGWGDKEVGMDNLEMNRHRRITKREGKTMVEMRDLWGGIHREVEFEFSCRDKSWRVVVVRYLKWT